MTLRVTKAFELSEIEAIQGQVTKAFVLSEIGIAELDVTKAFFLLELGTENLYVSQAFVLTELGIAFPTILPTLGNFGCWFGGVDVTAHVVSSTLESQQNKTAVDTFEVDDLKFTPGLTSWRSELKGFWTSALDDVFGEAASNEQNKVTYVFQIGVVPTEVSYTWTDEAFVSSYKIETNIDGALTYTASIALSGPPTRFARG